MPDVTELTNETTIRRNADKFLTSALKDEIVMMNIDNGDYLGVNSVGSDIWNLLSEPMSVNEVIVKTLAMYDVDEDQGRTEIRAFIDRMLRLQMIAVDTE